MYVLQVIPLSRTAPPEPLSYRSSAKISVGTIVQVPLRRQVLPGLVVDCIPVREAKYALKSGSFTLKSATLSRASDVSKNSDAVQGTLPKALIHAAEEVALYHATSVGAVLSALLIPVLPAEFSEFPQFFSRKILDKNNSDDLGIIRVEAPFISRREEYEKQIMHARESSSTTSRGATLFVVPTQTEDEWAVLLKKFAPVVISGKVTGKRREAALGAAAISQSVVIVTPSFAWVPISKLAGIIIERASAGTYRLPKRPYIDVRYALASLARSRSATLTYGDFPLPLEYREVPEAALAAQENTGDFKLYDARPPKKIAGSETDRSRKEDREPWQAVPEKILGEIRKTLSANGRVAMLAVRRGYSPTVVCRDCGTAVTDENGTTLSLATLAGKRVFRSTDGRISSDENMFCKVCGGWNLQPLGIGVERVEEELHAAFPDAPIIRIDQDTRSTASLKKAREELSAPGTIIVGTEIMLPLLSPYEPVDLGVISSADSLLALPFWRSRERFVRLGLMLAERSKRGIIVTRRLEDAALSVFNSNETQKDASKSTAADAFWKEETSLRKILSYPPFGTLIVFKIEGSAARLSEARAAIRAACLPYVPFEPGTRASTTTPENAPADASVPNVVGSSTATLVLQLPDGAWPDRALSERLSHLSPAIRIHIDSESLW
jgi:primosomal protein N'